MARLNITLPDALYARLEQLRDRINLSKVCALALEKEVTMLEGQPNFTDPRIARLVQRLQSTRERWHQRGYDDGIQWAVELASREELQSVATHLAEHDGQQLAAFFHKMTVTTHFASPLPPSPQPVHHKQQHIEAGLTTISRAVPHPSMPPVHGMSVTRPDPDQVFFHHGGLPFPGFPDSFHPAERIQYWEEQDCEMSGQAAQGEAARIEIDEAAYLEGWRDAVKGIWLTIAPALS